MEQDKTKKDMLVRKDFIKKNAILMMYDIVDFTSYCDYHEKRGNDERVYSLLNGVVNGCNEIIRDFGGNPHTFTGDGYISSFYNNNNNNNNNNNTSERAIDAALKIQDIALKVRKNFGGRNPKLKVALYKGPTNFGVLDSALRPFGRAPCKLSRIESLAKPGEILVSGSVINPVMDLYNFEEFEEVYLKGISEQKMVYKILNKK